MTDLADLIARARRRDPEAAIALADLVEINLLPQMQGARNGRARRRGGDSRAEDRADRNGAVLGMAELLGADLSLEERAAVIAAKIVRYRPAPSDACNSGERGFLHRIWKTGLTRRCGERQIRRILAQK